MNYLIEFSFSLGLFVNAILFIPQIIRLYKMKDSEEVSFITFFGFLLILVSTVLHGVINKDYLLTFGTIASIIPCAIVVWLILYYRLNKNYKLK